MNITRQLIQGQLTPILFFVSVSFAFAQGAAKPTEVVVERVNESRVVDRLEALGTLRANETVNLTTNVVETVSAIFFEDGQSVKSGDVLAGMTSTEENAQLKGAQFALEESLKQVNRLNILVKRNLAPQSQLDEYTRNYKNDKARLAEIQSRLQDRLITAPFSGVVGLRSISVGALVRPGDHIATLTDNRFMKLDFSVPTTYLSALKQGLPVVARARPFGDREFSGNVVSIDNQIDPVTRSILVRANIQNTDGVLRQGLLMSVELHKNPRSSLQISESALMPDGRSNTVFVAKENAEGFIVEKRPVEIGTRSRGKVEVVRGLSAGERVVTHGAIKVRHNQAISITESNSGTTEALVDSGIGVYP